MNPIHLSELIPAPLSVLGGLIPDPVAAACVAATAGILTVRWTHRALAGRDRIALLTANLHALREALDEVWRAAFEACYQPKQTEQEYHAAAVQLPQLCIAIKKQADLYFHSLSAAARAVEEGSRKLSLWLLEYRGSELSGTESSRSEKFRRDAPSQIKEFAGVVAGLREGIQRTAGILSSGSLPAAVPARRTASGVAAPAGTGAAVEPLHALGGSGIAGSLRTIAHALLTPRLEEDDGLLRIHKTLLDVRDGWTDHGWTGPEGAPPAEAVAAWAELFSEIGLPDPAPEQLCEIARRLRAACIRRRAWLGLIIASFAILCSGILLGAWLTCSSI